MSCEEDVRFLREFRGLIDEYLFLGYAPPEENLWGHNTGLTQMREALKKPEFADLRRNINEMSLKAHNLLTETNVHNMVQEYPPPAIGGPIRTFKLFDLVTRNSTSSRMDKNEFLDPIDQAIGALNAMEVRSVLSDNLGNSTPAVTNLVFIAMPMDPTNAALEDVHNSVKEVAEGFGLRAERVDDIQTNERITDTLLQAIREAKIVIVDLTQNKPNVYLEAGYALGQRKTPIFIAREQTSIEFDLKDYPILFFRNMTELKRILSARLASILSEE